MSASTPELDALDPQSREITLESGLAVEVVPLKTRQMLRLIRVLTTGAAPMLGSLNFSSDASTEEFAVQLLTIVTFAIPEAEDEAMEFVQSMVQPVGLNQKRVLNKIEKESNQRLWDEVLIELDNPELEDTLAIFENIFAHEAEHLQSLGKRLGAMLKASGVMSPETQASESLPTEADSSEPTPED